MEINCVHCGHNLVLPDSYQNYEGLFACFVCRAQMQIKIVNGEVHSVLLKSLLQMDEQGVLDKNKEV